MDALIIKSIDLFWLTPNAVKPKRSTKKFTKSHKKINVYTSAETRSTTVNKLLKKFMNGEQYFVFLLKRKTVLVRLHVIVVKIGYSMDGSYCRKFAETLEKYFWAFADDSSGVSN